MSIKSKKNNEKPSSKNIRVNDKALPDAINDAFNDLELQSIGKICFDARLKKGLTHQQVSASLNIKKEIIKDFEDGEKIDLPSLAYKLGFIRSYSRLLGLDSNVLVEEYKRSLEMIDYKEEYNFLVPINYNNKILPVGSVLSLLIAVFVYSAWYYSDRATTNTASIDDIKQNIKTTELNNNLNYQIIEEDFEDNLIRNSDQDLLNKNRKLVLEEITQPDQKFKNDTDILIESNKRKDGMQANVQNEINELSAKANIRDPKNEMVLKASGNSWVEIEDIDGTILFARLMRPGETYIVPKIKGLTINSGNAGVLSLSLGNTFLPKLGEVGEIITAKPLNIQSFSNITN
jgi:cytoskeleton protein RodZ